MKRVHSVRYGRRSLGACLVGLAVMCGVLPADGATVYQYNGQYVVWPDNECVRYLSPSAFPEGSVAESLILESMGLWNIVPGSSFQYFYSPLDQDYPIDSYDGYNDTAVVPASQLDPGVLGITYLVNDGAAWFDTDVLFPDSPDGVGFSLESNPTCELLTTPTPTNGYVFLLSATHEMGHSLGLGHDPMGDEPPGTPWFIATMNPAYPAGGTSGQQNIIEVHADDRAGLRVLYPPDPGETPIAELANAMFTMSPVIGVTEPLSVSPAAAYPGEQITANSVVENFGTTAENGVEQGFYLSTDETIETTDEFLGALAWDFVVGDAFAFEVDIDLPFDLPAGSYYIGSILDDLGAVTEEYEDNNAAVTCDPISILQYPPAIDAIPEQVAGCGLAYTGPTPPLTRPINMSPVSWVLDNGPTGMTVSPTTGVVTWPDPIPAMQPYSVSLQGTNGTGQGTITWQLRVALGDLDGNGLVDRSDLNSLVLCISGPTTGAGSGCTCADEDQDGDLDLRDVAVVQTVFGR